MIQFWTVVTTCATACTAQPFGVPDGGVQPADAGPDLVRGEELFSDPFSPNSKLACSNCHALEEPAEDGIRHPAHQLGDAAKRPSFKNARLATLFDAVNCCRVEWMKTTAWSAEDPDWLALSAFLASRAPASSAPAITFQIAEPPADTSGGDSTRGQMLVNQTCSGCHGADTMGTELAPPLKGAHLDGAYVARRARKSGPAMSANYPGLLGGLMPFWSSDRLSDAELLDIIAFIVE